MNDPALPVLVPNLFAILNTEKILGTSRRRDLHRKLGETTDKERSKTRDSTNYLAKIGKITCGSENCLFIKHLERGRPCLMSDVA